MAKKDKEVVKKKKVRAAEVEAPVKKKKKAVVDDAPAKKKKKVAEAEAPAKKKKKKVVEDDASSKKKKVKKSEKAEKSSKKKARKEKVVEPITPVKTKFRQTALYEHLAEESGVDKKAVKAVIEAFTNTLLGSVVKKGIGEFQLTGVMKVVTKKIAAKKGGEKKISPFTGEEIITKAKPATVRIKIRPLKKLKDAALQ